MPPDLHEVATLPVHIITGPTGSGKSALAMALAREQDAAIINADSMQLYSEAPVLTAQPSAQEQAEIPHHLYGILSADDPCSVVRWLEMAVSTIHRCWREGRLPIVVGGTGLYLKALMGGIVEVPTIQEEIRNEVRAMRCEALYAALIDEDPDMAARLEPGDRQRLARALEVIRSTGASLLYWQAQPVEPPLPEAEFNLRPVLMERDALYARINTRFDHMMEAGAVAEAQALDALGLPDFFPLMRAVGVAELLRYVRGELMREEAVELAKRNSRRYAKRQLTWLRGQLSA